MKREFILVPLLLLTPLWAELSREQIDKMVIKIQDRRISNVDVDFDKVKPPFIVVKQNEEGNQTTSLEVPQKKLEWSLNAIMTDDSQDGSTAFINGKWHKVGDEIQGYRLEKIRVDMVLLHKGDRDIRLFLTKSSKIPQIQFVEDMQTDDKNNSMRGKI